MTICYYEKILKVLSTHKLLSNSRFYIVTGSMLISILIFMYLQIVIIQPSARYIRLQEIYGSLALVYWYIVLLLSAVAKVVRVRPWIKSLLFTRRALGAMVAYFALLHAYISFVTQLNGFSGLTLLPRAFFWSLFLGFVSLLVLLIMALLSVDKIIAVLKFRQWKALQRVSYGAGIIAIMHVWIIGSHVGSWVVQIIVFGALVLLFGLQSWRISIKLTEKRRVLYARTISLIVWMVLCGGLIGMKLYVVSYSKNHTQLSSQGVIIHAH